MILRRFFSFQFLIGKLKTALAVICLVDGDLFQFLIGKLKTRDARRQLNSNAMFQFLIGKLKTLKVDNNMTIDTRVSIPHR